MPVSAMTVRTSAKSTLIMPGRVISSAIPWTAPCSTWFAALNASSSVTSPPSTVSSFWFGIVISESQCLPSSAMPVSAEPRRLRPSMSNGFVTTATVRMPSSFATCATTGAAPVPVPPPMPAVMNSMSEPSIISMMRSRSSIAAWRPDLGIGAGAESLGDVAADLQADLHLGVLERLRIGVDANEIHAFDPGGDHVRDGVAAAAADPDHLDHGALVFCISEYEHR